MRPALRVLRWIGGITVWQIIRVILIAALVIVAIPLGIFSVVGLGITWYLPITLGALAYNRTLAHWFNRPAFRPYW